MTPPLCDTASIIAQTQSATAITLLFFNIVAIIASVLCFFLLWLSFEANIRENAWEFGVLRAIGLNSGQAMRVYIYEALAIILAALVLGSLTGASIAVTLTLQFNLFTEMPFEVAFPYSLFFMVVSMAVVTAVLGSYIPARAFQRKEIAISLKAGG
eukprot:CAMPEP_0177632462 /NCGR_PEP_ID=MMETSP0447-20121125/2307_1 /TAXON_ID=0 /ORGANISM="Stygamoeba regulata, Strain BSH-02190019" /LENGTH=155 /DNA_ID=CAMNT_0019134037 /DNA_START=49 /DNA_END=516 /DNA_ORIENTATION=+